jgi:hypothetical protein
MGSNFLFWFALYLLKGNVMKLENIRSIARMRGIPHEDLSKTELIRMLQICEGNFNCFGTAVAGVCDQADCLWREDCFATARKGELS